MADQVSIYMGEALRRLLAPRERGKPLSRSPWTARLRRAGRECPPEPSQKNPLVSVKRRGREEGPGPHCGPGHPGLSLRLSGAGKGGALPRHSAAPSGILEFL
jgi:hypothetical protein